VQVQVAVDRIPQLMLGIASKLVVLAAPVPVLAGVANRAEMAERRCHGSGGLLLHGASRQREPVPLEYSIGVVDLRCGRRLDAVVLGWPGAAQDRLRADASNARLGRLAVPWRPRKGCRTGGTPA
jgi:hypothetical protein